MPGRPLRPVWPRKIERIRDRDFERLYAEHAQNLFRFLISRTGDRTLSEDLLADTFEKVLRARRVPALTAHEKPWLYTIALNCLRDSARRGNREARALGLVAGEQLTSPDVTVTEDAVVSRDQVRAKLALLAQEEREALALRFGADLSVPEIAAVLNIPLTTAESRVYRALRKLRETLA